MRLSDPAEGAEGFVRLAEKIAAETPDAVLLLGLLIQGLGFGLGFRAEGLGFRVSGLGFRV